MQERLVSVTKLIYHEWLNLFSESIYYEWLHHIFSLRPKSEHTEVDEDTRKWHYNINLLIPVIKPYSQVLCPSNKLCTKVLMLILLGVLSNRWSFRLMADLMHFHRHLVYVAWPFSSFWTDEVTNNVSHQNRILTSATTPKILTDPTVNWEYGFT